MVTLSQLQEKIGPHVTENESLAPYSWFKIGGPARYFFATHTNDELVTAVRVADELGLHYFILGSGSNLLIADSGFDGLVIHPMNKGYRIDGTKVYVESGALVVDIMKATLAAGLTGWSWAAGLPGTIGAAIRGNAGAYGKGMGDIVATIDLYRNGKVEQLPASQFGFSYRHSLAKDEPSVVISAVLQLNQGDLDKEQSEVAAYIQRRETTQPLEYPNVGCIFKNIDLATTSVDVEKICHELDITVEEYQQVTKFHKLPVSFIVDHLGLKKKQIGGAQISEKHAAFIVNIDHATAEQVIMLISDIKMRVRDQLGIQLEEEIQYVGF